MTFLNPARRKAIYNIFAVLNAVVVALVPVAIQFGFIPAEWSENIIQTAAGVLSVAGFMLASKNTDKPVAAEPSVEDQLGYKPEGAVVTEAN
jgi:hypothetical protein